MEEDSVVKATKAKSTSLDKSKYCFLVETAGELSDHDTKRSFVVTKYEFATNDGDGDFVLYLDIDNVFQDTSNEPFSSYFDVDKGTYCEGIRHYPVAPCPIQISVKNQETGKQAELFDFSLGMLWLYNSLEEYTDASSSVLGELISAGKDKPNGRFLHIYNKCKNLKNCTMKIVLFQSSGTTRLGIRILVESSKENVQDFFEETLGLE